MVDHGAGAVTELWLVRHGQTAWSRQRRHTGRTDLPLEPEGEEDARRLAKALAGTSFDLVLASPLQRAWRTAELAGLHPVAEPRAVEWDYGDYEGMTSEEIHRSVPGWTVWTHPLPGGETLDQVGARADAVLAGIRERDPTRCLLVSHGHFLRVLAARWIEQSSALGAHLDLEPARPCVLGNDRGVPWIHRWNA